VELYLLGTAGIPTVMVGLKSDIGLYAVDGASGVLDCGNQWYYSTRLVGMVADVAANTFAVTLDGAPTPCNAVQFAADALWDSDLRGFGAWLPEFPGGNSAYILEVTIMATAGAPAP